ncbi:MAG: HEAT repeat domain-containing protein [Planctomycetes bacterium]|nr:HEAT repeat domain-containing protein [Planctomycetota bacterium]
MRDILWLLIVSCVTFVALTEGIRNSPAEPSYTWHFKQLQSAHINAQLLNLLGDPAFQKSVKKIASFMNNKDSFLRKESVYAIAKLGAKEYSDDVAKLLSDSDIKVKRNAIWALGSLGSIQYADKVAAFLDDSNSEIRGSAVIALGQMRAKKHRQKISSLTNDTGTCWFYDKELKKWKIVSVKESASLVLSNLN